MATARGNAFAFDWAGYTPPKPEQLGVFKFENYPLAAIAEYIDWSPFFNAWELYGKYPKILEDKVVGEEAKKLFADAQAVLRQMIAENWVRASGVIGLFPANNVNNEDIELYDPATGRGADDLAQSAPAEPESSRQNQRWCLADFVAPKESGKVDYLGAFAVTAGLGIDEHVARFEAAHDDYHAIMVKALADRLAKAFTELMHAKVRRSCGATPPRKFSITKR